MRLRAAANDSDEEEEEKEEKVDEPIPAAGAAVGHLRPVEICQVPVHPHPMAAVSDGTAFSQMQGFTTSWRCDLCRTSHSSNAGRWRCVGGCDFDGCGPCISRFGRRGITVRQEVSKALPKMAGVGDVVVLTPEYAKYFDAAGGPLKPGLAGIVVEDDRADLRLPLRVMTFLGSKWWYARPAVRVVGQAGDVVDDARAQLGVPVVRGPDW